MRRLKSVSASEGRHLQAKKLGLGRDLKSNLDKNSLSEDRRPNVSGRLRRSRNQELVPGNQHRENERCLVRPKDTTAIKGAIKGNITTMGGGLINPLVHIKIVIAMAVAGEFLFVSLAM